MDKSEILTSVNRCISSRRTRFLQAFTILSNDSDKSVNNEKDDTFGTMTIKEQVMIFFMTKGSFLLQGFWQLRDNHKMIRINSLPEVKKVGDEPFKVIIDIYHNHILDEETIKSLEKLDAERIIVLAPYHIGKLKAKTPVHSVSRKESVRSLPEIIYSKYLPHKNSQLCSSHNRLKIIQLILKNKNESDITSTLGTSQQILRIQKFNIIYKLGLRCMSNIVTLGITPYFQ